MRGAKDKDRGWRAWRKQAHAVQLKHRSEDVASKVDAGYRRRPSLLGGWRVAGTTCWVLQRATECGGQVGHGPRGAEQRMRLRGREWQRLSGACWAA